MISLGLVDEFWTNRFSPELHVRPRERLDNPEGLSAAVGQFLGDIDFWATSMCATRASPDKKVF
jgi:hypothetical protein